MCPFRFFRVLNLYSKQEPICVKPTSLFQKIKKSITGRIAALSSRDTKIFAILAFILICGIIGTINEISNRISVQVPAKGGVLREGMLGTPRFINPVLAVSDIDKDLSELVYSGLVRRVPNTENSGSIIIPDLAESYSISDDGKTYTFILKKDISFQDRKPVTATDVVFTIKTIQNNQFQSPIAANWVGITAEVVDNQTVKITLSRPYSGFLDAATVGILPEHIWGSFSPEEFFASKYNTFPIGTGPYKVTDVSRDKNGIADTYIMSAFKKFSLGKPLISKIAIKLYPNEQDLMRGYEAGDFDSLANIRPYEMNERNTKYRITQVMPRMFGLFLNTEKNELFKDTTVRSIIEKSINPTEIIQNVFQGYAEPINHPLSEITKDTQKNTIPKNELVRQLENAGWKLNPATGIREKSGKQLSFTISTADTAELKYTAQIIQKQLQDFGIGTELQVFQLNDLENSVIKKRSFDALLFGQFIRNDADLYAFWHSSQKDPGGLNITGYSNKNLDTLIEKLFTTIDSTPRTSLLHEIKKELETAPVIWIYQPDFIYALRRPIYGINLANLISKHDRFATIYQWYLQTDTVWKLFNKKTD